MEREDNAENNYCNYCEGDRDEVHATTSAINDDTKTHANVENLILIVNDLTKIVNELKEKVDKIIQVETSMNEIETSCKNMDRHIQFVEETYNNLCQTKPFLIASKVSNFLRREATNKPIEN